MAVLQTGLAKSLAEDYTIDQSLRFNAGDSAYLSRTFSSGNQRKFTISFWTKRAVLGTNQRYISVGTGSTVPRCEIGWMTSDAFRVGFNPSGDDWKMLETTAVYRDVGAWYHVVIAVDTEQSVASNREKLYINGEQVTAFDTENYVGEDDDLSVNSAVEHRIGANGYSPYMYGDNYLAEYYFTDGTAYAASDFGETDSTTNQWKPIDASGLTFGTNGFYQKYASTELANSFFDSGNGGRHVVTANGGAHTDTAVKKFGTASAQFDGVGDFLSIPDSSDFDFGTSTDFTIDFWFRCPTQVDSYPSVMGSGTATWSTNSNAVRIGPNGDLTKLEFYHYSGNGASPMLTSTTSVNDSTWRHGAIVRSGSTWYLFINGTKEDTYTGTNPDTDLSDNGYFYIGKNGWDAGGGEYIGYIDELRVSNVSRWTADFDEPTEALTNDINTMLLLHCDGSNDGTSFPDSASHPITAVGNVANTRAEKKVGDSSIAFDGSGDGLTLPASSDWVFADGEDFTFEGWINTDKTNECIYENKGGVTSTPGWAIFVGAPYTTGKLEFYNQDDTRCASTTTVTDSAWYHFACVMDSDTLRLYINGVQEDSAANGTTAWGRSNAPSIGQDEEQGGTTRDYSGYMDEIRFSNVARYPDGTTFTPQTTEFTSDSNTLLLIHSDWTGGLGADSSGNFNTFTVTNLVATDQMKDSPTNNFCTLNSAIRHDSPAVTLAEGNLKSTEPTGSTWAGVVGTQAVATGKWYWEAVHPTGSGAYMQVGVCSNVSNQFLNGGTFPQDGTGTILYYAQTGHKRISNVDTSYGASFGARDIIGIALNMDDSEITFYKNNASQGAISFSGGITSADLVMPCSGIYSSVQIFNFGQDSSFAGTETAQGNQDSNGVGDFYYEPPTDFLALSTSNLSAPEIKLPGDHFNTVIYTGNTTDPRSITGVGFQPDLVWGKSRATTWTHKWQDAVRGSNKTLFSSASPPDGTEVTNYIWGYLSSFDSDGFTIAGGASGDDSWNENTSGNVAWNWLGDGVAGGTLNEDGSEDSQVNVNTTSGFSIATYTGTGSLATIGHGLTQAPELVIIKDRDAAEQWVVYAEPIGNTKFLKLSADSASTTDTSGNRWNSTSPSATVFTVNIDSAVNTSTNDYVAYCFHSVEGYSKIGSYEGNGNADGTFVYTGFRPAWVMIKNIDSTPYWTLMDNKRDGYNVDNNQLYPNSSEAESTSDYMDIVSNGFKFRDSDDNVNSSATFIYLAFAEAPFKYANAR